MASDNMFAAAVAHAEPKYGLSDYGLSDAKADTKPTHKDERETRNVDEVARRLRRVLSCF